MNIGYIYIGHSIIHRKEVLEVCVAQAWDVLMVALNIFLYN